MPRGGRRIGAGRKPKNQTAKLLQHPSSTQGPVNQPATNQPKNTPIQQHVDPPPDLSPEALVWWRKQAPNARLLTNENKERFAFYCKYLVIEEEMYRSVARGGSDHRGLMRELRTLEALYGLVPDGKAALASDSARVNAQDSDDAFFGGGHGR